MTQSQPVPFDGLASEGVETIRYEFEIREKSAGRRLDAYVAARFPEYSRSFIQALMREGAVTLNGRRVKPSHKPVAGDVVLAFVPTQRHTVVPPQDIPLDVIYEDDSFVVLNKAADMVVHPSKGHSTGTLVNALVFHFQNLSSNCGPLRPGVVHRLDRDTTGAILVIKDDRVHEAIALQFERRETRKEYVCVVEGQPELDGDIIDVPIGHSARDRKKMSVRADGKTAQTRYEVAERLGRFAVVRCFPRSGRTHQIRVHMQYIGHPLVCDKLYGRRQTIYASDLTGAEHQPGEPPLIDRQALHARRITIHHPVRNEPMTFEAPMPPDMLRLIEALREAAKPERPQE